jgi:hypothetical protein
MTFGPQSESPAHIVPAARAGRPVTRGSSEPWTTAGARCYPCSTTAARTQRSEGFGPSGRGRLRRSGLRDQACIGWPGTARAHHGDEQNS